MRPTLVRITYVNSIMNPYSEKRPKKPEKKYNIYDMFMNMSKMYKFPFTKTVNGSVISSISIESISVCLPGGRGCVGKERMGKTKMNRQTAIMNAKGLRFNPLHNKNNKTKYGQIQMTGTVKYKDGTMANLNIPVETSGVVGVRMGTTLRMNPSVSNSEKRLKMMIDELEPILLSTLGIKKERATRIISMNGIFNLYTDKEKTDRPKIKNFKTFLKMMSAEGLKEKYTKKTKTDDQGRPSVMKMVYRSKDSSYPTITLSPYGHVEMMGAVSFKMIRNAYELLNRVFDKIKSNVEFTRKLNNISKSTKPKKVPKLLSNVSIFNSNIKYNNAKKELIIKRKRCAELPKPILVQLMKRYGLLEKGKRNELCERLKKKMNLKL